MALFIRYFGPETYHSDRWPTQDKIIPFRVFELMYESMDNLMALEQLLAMQSVAHGAAVAMNGSDPKVKNATRALARTAHPEVRMETDGPGQRQYHHQGQEPGGSSTPSDEG